MSRKSYEESWAKIGNSSGYRLSSEFFKENPDFVGAGGLMQVISPDTAVFSIAMIAAELFGEQSNEEIFQSH
ncbi:MAG: hypothetical protein AAFR58_07720 [Cyanobacteria bacterium J06627_28]